MIKKINYPGWELKYFDKAKNFRNYQFNLIKNKIKGNVCEIGPGTGIFCEKYLDRCNKITLYEPTEKFFIKLKKKFFFQKKIKVIGEEFREIKKKFDCIILMDVIEHINYPDELLKKCYKSLNINGLILINVPAFPVLFSEFDRDVGHFERYTKNSIIKKISFMKSIKINFFYYDSIGFFLSLLSKFFFQKSYKSNFDKKIIFWDILIPISRLLDLIFSRFFGKSLFVEIKKVK